MSLKSNFPAAERIYKTSRRKLAPSVSKLKSFQSSIARHSLRDERIAAIAVRLAARRKEREIIDGIPHGTRIKRVDGGVSFVGRGSKGRFETKLVKF